MSWETVDLPYPEALYERYLREPSVLATRFEDDPRDPGWPFRRLEYLEGRHFAREALAAGLVDYNRRVGAGPAALANAAALGRPGSVAVVGGQQAGLLTGPLYTICKAVTVLQLTRELGRRLQVPVIPCFWVAAEDHDLDEVDHAWLLDAAGTLVRLRLELPPAGRLPVGAIPPGPGVAGLLDQVEEVVPPSEHRATIIARLRETATEAGSLADWFARIMAWLFAPWGLVLVNPVERAFRDLAADTFGQVLEEEGALAGAVDEGTRAVGALGYDPQLQAQPGQVHLFLAGPRGDRLPLFRVPDGLVAGSGASSARLDLAETARLARTEPWRFSANVVSRPLVQEAVLPVLAQVSGPGETGYHAQLREAFRVFRFRLPVLWPRLALTVVDGPVRRLMARYQVDLARGPTGLRERLESVLRGLDQSGFEETFSGARGAIGREYERIFAAVHPLDPAMDRLTAENRRRVLAELDYLLGRARRAHRQRQEVVLGHFRRLEGHLFPRGKGQERVLNVVPWLCRYGQVFLSWLVEAPLAADFRHRALYL